MSGNRGGLASGGPAGPARSPRGPVGRHEGASRPADPALRDKRCLLAITGAFHSNGGIAAVNRLALMALADAGYRLDVLVLNEDTLPVDARYVPPDRVSVRAFRNNKLRFASALWQEALKHRYELVGVDLVNLALAAAPLKWVARRRYFVWLFGLEVFPPRPSWEGCIGLRNAWRAVAISRYTRDSVVSRFPGVAVSQCDLAVDPVRHPRKDPYSLVPSQPLALVAVDGERRVLGGQVLLHVSRMDAREQCKGQDALLLAFPAVRRAFPDAQLVLVGEGSDAARLLDLARSLPDSVREGIFFPGYVEEDDVRRIYGSCYAFVMPSLYEGFGLVYLEAMNLAKPCIGARAFATPCVVRDGVTGVLVEDPRSPGQVGSAICRLMSNPDRAAAMGLAGWELVQSHYRFEHFKERFWKAISP